MKTIEFSYEVNYAVKRGHKILSTWHTPECATAALLQLLPDTAKLRVNGHPFTLDQILPTPITLLLELERNRELVVLAPSTLNSLSVAAV